MLLGIFNLLKNSEFNNLRNLDIVVSNVHFSTREKSARPRVPVDLLLSSLA